MWAIFFSGPYVGMDFCLQFFKRIAANAGHQVPSSEAVSRFRTGLKELSGSFVNVGDREISFANPGIRDFLSKIFIDDHLLPIVVRSVSTIYEFRSAWNFFKTNINLCCDLVDDHDLWIAAIDRIQGDKSTTAIASLRHILEMCEHLPSLHIKAVLDRAVNDLISQGIETRDHYECLFSLQQLKRLQSRTGDLLDPAFKALTNAAANMLANAGEDLAIDDIISIARALEPVTEHSLVRSAASDALRGFIFGIENKLSDVSSSQELDTFRNDLVCAAETYGVRIDAALTQDIQSRRESLEAREGGDDTDPYQSAPPQAATGEISDAEIKSMFALMDTGPVSV
jgi:hypothetical protein